MNVKSQNLSEKRRFSACQFGAGSNNVSLCQILTGDAGIFKAGYDRLSAVWGEFQVLEMTDAADFKILYFSHRPDFAFSYDTAGTHRLT